MHAVKTHYSQIAAIDYVCIYVYANKYILLPATKSLRRVCNLERENNYVNSIYIYESYKWFAYSLILEVHWTTRWLNHPSSVCVALHTHNKLLAERNNKRNDSKKLHKYPSNASIKKTLTFQLIYHYTLTKAFEFNRNSLLITGKRPVIPSKITRHSPVKRGLPAGKMVYICKHKQSFSHCSPFAL